LNRAHEQEAAILDPRADAIRELLAEGSSRRRLERDLALAHSLQSALLPAVLPNGPELEIAACSEPSRILGGDFYDYLPIDARLSALAIGDATGNGLSAALLIAQVQALLKAGIRGGLPRLMETLNEHLARLTTSGRCVTLFCGVFDRYGDSFQYCNAGHNAPILLRADGSHELLETGGMLLGAFAAAEYRTGEVRVRRGDCLLLYTDGVTDASGRDGGPYGEPRLRDVLFRCRGLAAGDTVRAIQADLAAFRGSEAAEDDLTILVLRKPGPCC